MLTVEHLTKRFDGVPVLTDFSCVFPETGIVAIAGPSGYGKTTLLRCIAGLEKPDGGVISGVPERIAYCFQEDRLLPWRTALGNLEAVLGKRRRAEALGWLERVGLADAADKYPSEPFHALDDATRADMESLLAEKSRGKLVLLVTHQAPPEGAPVVRIGER